MKGTTLIKAEIGNYKENELIFSSKLYKEKLSGCIEEAAYYKSLERMCRSGELVRAAKGIYHLPKKSKYGAIPPSESEIVGAFTRNSTGTIIGYSLYNRLGLTTQIPKTVQVLSSAIDEMSRTIRNVVVHRSGLDYNNAVENMVHGLDVLQNFNNIQDIDYKAFVIFAKDFAADYDDAVFERVIADQNYKKSTLSFLQSVLNYFNVSNCIGQHLSSLSKYKHPEMEDIYEAAHII